jgi:hypothetical protein
MLYLAVEQRYEGLVILGAAYSIAGAKRIAEDNTTSYRDDGSFAWHLLEDRWVGQPHMQEYCRRTGREIWRMLDHPDVCILAIEPEE